MYIKRDVNGKIIARASNLQEGFTEEETPVEMLDEIKSRIWEKIKAKRDNLKFNGVFVSGKWIHTDTYSRTQWMGMVMMGTNLPVVPWTTMDGTTINTSPELATAVFQAVATQDIVLFNAAATHKAQLSSSLDPESYDFSTGWPATFTNQ